VTSQQARLLHGDEFTSRDEKAIPAEEFWKESGCQNARSTDTLILLLVGNTTIHIDLSTKNINKLSRPLFVISSSSFRQTFVDPLSLFHQLPDTLNITLGGSISGYGY